MTDGMQFLSYRGNRLYCEGVAAEEIAARFGTPVYVYSRAQLLANLRRLRAPLAAENPQHALSYALKANANPALLKLLSAERIGADVVSGGELRAALHAGFPPAKITYAGVGKRDDEIALALAHGIFALNAESEAEIAAIAAIARQRNVRARVAIRVNPEIAAESHPYISTGMAHNKFGIPIAAAPRVFAETANAPEVELVGVHAHIGSQITSAKPFVAAARSLAGLVRLLRGQGVAIAHVNIGGGIGIRYAGVVAHPLLPPEEDRNGAVAEPEEILRSMLPILRETGCPLIIEPGRAIAGNAGALLTRVLYTKQNPAKHFSIVDAAMTDLLRPSLYGAYHQIVPATLEEREIVTTDVVGPVCESSDFLARDRRLRLPRRGDVLAVLCTGAYGYALASNYTLRPRPAEVLAEGDAVRIVREREDVVRLAEETAPRES